MELISDRVAWCKIWTLDFEAGEFFSQKIILEINWEKWIKEKLTNVLNIIKNWKNSEIFDLITGTLTNLAKQI